MTVETSPLLSEMKEMPDQDVSFDSLRNLVEGDELLEELHGDLVTGAHRYFETVLAFERMSEIQKHRLEPVVFRERMEQHDRTRRLAHNALVDRFRILARATSQEGINTDWFHKISGPEENRRAIGQWALRMVFEDLYVKGDPDHE